MQPLTVLLTIDIAKLRHEVLIDAPGWKSRKHLVLLNTAVEFRRFADYLHGLKYPVRIAFEVTGNYHRRLTVARTREAMHKSWDKNDPKDAQVLLHLMRKGLTRHYHAPLVNHIHDFQQLSLTYAQVPLEKTCMQYRLLTHYLQLYFPRLSAITMPRVPSGCWSCCAPFHRLLEGIHPTAQSSIGLPVEQDSEAVAMFRTVLDEMIHLCELRHASSTLNASSSSQISLRFRSKTNIHSGSEITRPITFKPTLFRS